MAVSMVAEGRCFLCTNSRQQADSHLANKLHGIKGRELGLGVQLRAGAQGRSTQEVRGSIPAPQTASICDPFPSSADGRAARPG